MRNKAVYHTRTLNGYYDEWYFWLQYINRLGWVIRGDNDKEDLHLSLHVAGYYKHPIYRGNVLAMVEHLIKEAKEQTNDQL